MFQSLTTQRRNSERQVLELRSQVAMEQQTSKTNKKGCFEGMEVIQRRLAWLVSCLHDDTHKFSVLVAYSGSDMLRDSRWKTEG